MISEPDAAPGRLETLRGFINTLTTPAGTERLGSLAAARAWCAEEGLTPPNDDAELETLRTFREGLRDVLSAHDDGGDPEPAWRALAPLIAGARLTVADEPPGELRLEGAGAGVQATIATLLAIVHDARIEGSWSRLRACRRDDCRWAYYDRSKNGSRAWCSMTTCGNRAKAQRRRARERTAD